MTDIEKAARARAENETMAIIMAIRAEDKVKALLMQATTSYAKGFHDAVEIMKNAGTVPA